MRKSVVIIAYTFIFAAFTLFIFSSFGQSMLSIGPLSSEHAKVKDCSSCHDPFNGVPKTRCLKCHQSIKKQETAKFGIHGATTKDCFSCHPEHIGGNLVSTLRSNDFRHKNRFLFAGGHEESSCLRCHKNKSFSKLTTRCSNCHSPDHDEEEQQSNNNCSLCHLMSSWEKLKIDHSPKADCLQCHQGPPNHFGKRCQSCHNTNDWEEESFTHPNLPGEAGEEHSYRSFSCSSCHPNGYGSYTCTKCHKNGNPDEGDDDD